MPVGSEQKNLDKTIFDRMYRIDRIFFGVKRRTQFSETFCYLWGAVNFNLKSTIDIKFRRCLVAV